MNGAKPCSLEWSFLVTEDNQLDKAKSEEKLKKRAVSAYVLYAL